MSGDAIGLTEAAKLAGAVCAGLAERGGDIVADVMSNASTGLTGALGSLNGLVDCCAERAYDVVGFIESIINRVDR